MWPRMPRRDAVALGPDGHQQLERDHHGPPDELHLARQKSIPTQPIWHTRTAQWRSAWPMAALLGVRPRHGSTATPTRRAITQNPTAVIAKSRSSNAREHRRPESVLLRSARARQCDRDVIVVVRRREPCEVHPRPPNGEEHKGERLTAWPLWLSINAWCRLDPACATATTKQRSKNSSSGVDARCDSTGSGTSSAGATEPRVRRS